MEEVNLLNLQCNFSFSYITDLCNNFHSKTVTQAFSFNREKTKEDRISSQYLYQELYLVIINMSNDKEMGFHTGQSKKKCNF